MKIYLIATLLGAQLVCRADHRIKVTDYSSNGVLDLEDTVNFIIDYHDLPLSALRPAPNKEATLESKLANSTVSGELWFIKKQAGPGHDSGPFTEAQVTAVLKQAKSPAIRYNELPAWQKIPPLTTPLLTQKQTYRDRTTGAVSERRFHGTAQDVREQQKAAWEDPTLTNSKEVSPASRSSFGPLRVRRDVDSVFSYAFDDDGLDALYALESAGQPSDLIRQKGARISFSDDRLQSNGQNWSTEGALVLPFHYYGEPDESSSLIVHAALAGSWKYESLESPDGGTVNELKLSTPLVVGRPGLGFFQLSPFYQTDTDFKGEFYGATASFSLFAEPFFGLYHPIGMVGTREFDVAVKMSGKMDYSGVGNASPYSPRKEGDEWFRAGAEAGLEFGLFDVEGKKAPITAAVSYQYLNGISGDGGAGHLFKASLSYWITNNAAFTMEYERGETLVAAKDIDLLTVGLEWRY